MAKTVENTKSSVDGASFEQALQDLEAIVRKLESGQGDLEASINDYVRGTELKKYCEEKLASARLKVESIMKTQDGGLTLTSFDAK
ncbi:MAG: exodeoxyribonuclease VII small subunit [Pseudomonadota bacterium]|nr:exodeoxyribonuclease VII small subunit [Pseudomonadota bacterium]